MYHPRFVHKLALDIYILLLKLVHIVGVGILTENMVFQLVVMLLAMETQILYAVVVGLTVFIQILILRLVYFSFFLKFYFKNKYFIYLKDTSAAMVTPIHTILRFM
jgi:hypothetical protein